MTSHLDNQRTDRPGAMTNEDRSSIAAELAAILHEASGTPLSDDERRWVRMAIQREAQSALFRRAVIEKTMGGLILVMFSAIGYFMLDWAKTHGFKP